MKEGDDGGRKVSCMAGADEVRWKGVVVVEGRERESATSTGRTTGQRSVRPSFFSSSRSSKASQEAEQPDLS